LIQDGIEIWEYLGNNIANFPEGKFTAEFKKFLGDLIYIADQNHLNDQAINKSLREYTKRNNDDLRRSNEQLRRDISRAK